MISYYLDADGKWRFRGEPYPVPTNGPFDRLRDAFRVVDAMWRDKR